MKITTKTYPSGKIYRYCVDGREVRKCEIETLACNTDEVIEIDYFTAKNFPLIEKPNTDMKVVFTGYCGGQKLMTKAAAVQLGAQIGRLQSRNIYYVTDETKAAETVTEADGYDESAFDLLTNVNELNDCRSDIEKEFDEFAAEDTDRDARFNHGERHAAKLEKKLRELDPTVEVTYDINEDDKDTFYLRFGKYVYRAPFATLDAVEDTFRLWSEDDDMQHDAKIVDAVEDVGKSTVELAEELTAQLLKVTPWHADFMDLTLQDGRTAVASPRTATIEPDWHGNSRFAFATPWNEIFARYDTATQVRTVINRIKHAVEDKRDKFKYPTLEEMSAPDYREKHWAIDFDIYHADSDLTDAELEAYTDKLREALTVNGNIACVELEDSVITIYGDNGGDKDTVAKIVTEMCKRGCWVEYPEAEGDANEKARLG